MNDIRKAQLRDIREKDLMLILNWRNREAIRKVMYNGNTISIEEHLQWFKRLEKDDASISKIFSYNQVDYGVLNIKKINRINNNCEWGFYIGEQNTLRGLGTILGFTALNYIFNELSIRKLSAEVLSINEQSISFHEKMGFVKEGVLRKHIKKDKDYIDISLYSLFKEEWENYSINIIRKIEGR